MHQEIVRITARAAITIVLTAAAAPGQIRGRRDPANHEAAAFFDKLMTNHMTADQVLGASAVVIRDGQMWLEQGYGFSDEQKTKPVEPRKTTFYAASLSKLFVATAVMQLEEQGRLDLRRDISDYLDFRLPGSPGRPVTLADLLTHTSGLDDHMIGAETPIGRSVDLGAYFRDHVPPRVRESGAEINYSNHGVALAARVVERISGTTFYDYAERQILSPAGMLHSSFRQPLPDLLRASLAFERFEKAYTIPYPVATLVTTPSDMGKFMLEHLTSEEAGVRILRDDTRARMHAQHFAPSPDLPGVAYGFFEAWDAGGRALFHAGARDHFSLLYLVPERRFGIYVVMCGASEQSQMLAQVVREFLRYLFGPPDAKGARIASAVPDWLPGRYRLDAISHATLEKLAGLGAEMQVKSAGNDLDVTLPSFSRGKSTERYVQVGPMLFRAKDGAMLKFRNDAQSASPRAFRSDFASDPMSLTRLRWYETSWFFLSSMVIAYALFLGFLLMSVFWAIRKRGPPVGRFLWHSGTLLSLCATGAPIVGILMALTAREHQLYTIERILKVVMSILNVAIGLSAVVLVIAPLVVPAKRWRTGLRFAFGALAFASFLFLRFIVYWHVWGYQF